MKRKNVRIVVGIVLGISVLVLVFNGITYLTLQKEYTNAQKSYESIRELNEKQENKYRINFEELQVMNSDIVGWIYGPGTKIDYPVLKAQDYSYYLTHLPDHTVNKNGSLFLDYNTSQDFKGPLEIIYGHHMASGDMFASLVDYKDPQYYTDHPILYLYTPNQNYEIKLVYGRNFEDGVWRDRGFMYPENVQNLLSFMKSESSFVSEIKPNLEDNYIVLSTCSFDFDGDRYAVIGIIEAID